MKQHDYSRLPIESMLSFLVIQTFLFCCISFALSKRYQHNFPMTGLKFIIDVLVIV